MTKSMSTGSGMSSTSAVDQWSRQYSKTSRPRQARNQILPGGRAYRAVKTTFVFARSAGCLKLKGQFPNQKLMQARIAKHCAGQGFRLNSKTSVVVQPGLNSVELFRVCSKAQEIGRTGSKPEMEASPCNTLRKAKVGGKVGKLISSKIHTG